MLLTGHNGAALMKRAEVAGVWAFLPKESPLSVIVGAVEEVASGHRIPFGTGEVSVPGAGINALTEREKEVLVHVANGLRNEEIGRRLEVSENVVRVHRAALMRKLDARSSADLTRVAVAAGLVRAD
jgi:DNA-binding NarL/FixJ family response regulator